jgi:hypothetical protein
MMWASSALPRNGRLLAVGGGREAMANDAHGVDVRKNCKAPVCQKKVKKREVTWKFGECPKRVGSFGYSTDFLMRGRYEVR